MPATERNSNLHIAAANVPTAPALLPVATQWQPLQGTQDGAIWTSIAAQSGGPGGTSTPVTLDEYTTDAIVPSTLESAGLTVSAGIRALNAAGNIDRLRALASDGDAQAAAQLGLLGAVARAQYFNGATFDRARSLASDTDAQVAAQLGLAGVVMRPYIYNGATYDRQRAPVGFTNNTAFAAGLTAIIPGIAGQRIRLLRYSISIVSQVAAAAAGDLFVNFSDAAVALPIAHVFFVPAVSVVTGFGAHTTGWVDIGPLGLLLGVGNALNVNLNFALTAGRVIVNVAYIQGVTT